MKNQHVDIDNARYDDQKAVMKEIMDAGHCPFCRENLQKYHKQPIIREGQYWLVTTNQWPYEHTKFHFLLIYKNHVTDLAGINTNAGKELIELAQWLQENYEVPGGGIALRFGDTDHSAGSVAHIHAQFVVPEMSDPNFEPIRIKIGKPRPGQPE